MWQKIVPSGYFKAFPVLRPSPEQKIKNLIFAVCNSFNDHEKSVGYFTLENLKKEPAVLLATLILCAKEKGQLADEDKEIIKQNRVRINEVLDSLPLEEKQIWFHLLVKNPLAIFDLLDLGMFDGRWLPVIDFKIDFKDDAMSFWMTKILEGSPDANQIKAMLLLAHCAPCFIDITNAGDLNLVQLSQKKLLICYPFLRPELDDMQLKGLLTALLQEFKKFKAEHQPANSKKALEISEDPSKDADDPFSLKV